MTLAYERASAEPRIELDLTHNHDGAHDDEQSASSDRNGAVSLMAGSPLATEVYALLPRASAKIAHICAEMLTSSGHMTQSLAFAFLARGDRSSLIALAGAQTLPSTLLLQRASAGTPEEARAIASRADLDTLILATLCDRLDPVIDYLGQLRTDSDGRLIVLGGKGKSSYQTATPPPLPEYGNNDGWFDDVSDGPVTVTVSIRGTSGTTRAATDPSDGAWVLCGPPDFAPRGSCASYASN